MKTNKIFTKSAEFYDEFYSSKDYKLEAKYFFSKFTEGKNLLDVGCGTGKYSLEFLKLGMNVTGIEYSKQMINKEIQTKSLNFINKDFLKYKSKKKYENISALFHVINYMNTPNKLNLFFKKSNDLLISNGHLVFDSWNKVSQKELPNTEKFFTKGHKDVYRFSKAIIKNKIVHVNFDYLIIDHNKKEFNTFNEEHLLCPYEPKALILAAEKFNFSLIESEEFMSGRKPTIKSKSITYVFKKNDSC